MFKTPNNYHPKIKLTIEINPPKFSDTEIIILNNEVITSVHRKESKLPVSWESKVPKHCKCNTILSEPHHERYPQIFKKKFKILKKNLVKQIFH